MYFLSEIDHKKLINKILPHAREVGVSDELRGWSWHKPPMKPYYEEERVPMYSICSKYCPTGRDVFLNRVEGKEGIVNDKMILGVAIHRTVGAVFDAFKEDLDLDFDHWYEDTLIRKARARSNTQPTS